jgi:peptidyl-prolyl cis-trans isomerase D
MLEFIRTHRRLTQFILLLFIIPSFAFVGLESYSRFRDGGNVVAKVAGKAITQQEFDAAQREHIEHYRQMLGAQFDQKMFDTSEAKQNVLDSLIAQRVLSSELVRNNITVSDQALQQTILGMPGLTTPDGQFDGDRYKSLLAAQGMSPAMYEARLRHDLALQQLNTAIESSAFAPKTVVQRISDMADQEREVQELLFKASDFVSQVKITDEMLHAFYMKFGSQFEIPEQIKAEYVVLNNDVLLSLISISDTDIKSYYEQNARRYTVDEQRRASHILIAVKKDATEIERTAAKVKAQNLLQQLRKNPGDFGKLAKENSQDPISAEHGGDLDFFGKGMMVKPFETAAYALKQGEISDLVESDFGFHIIQVTAVKSASVKTLDEVRNEIVAEIKKQKASKKYSELAESFVNTVYEQSDSLKTVAERLKLKIETVSDLTRQSNSALAPTVPFNHPKFLKAIFSDDAVKNKRNTEAIEVAPNTLIAGHVVEYKPASKRPFEEVKMLIAERVKQVEALVLAKKAGEARLHKLKQTADSTGFSSAQMVSRVSNKNLDSAALTAVMKADANKLPSHIGIELPNKIYAIYRINKIAQPVSLDSARRLAEQKQIVNAAAQLEMMAYIDSLKHKSKVTISKPVAVDTNSQ